MRPLIGKTKGDFQMKIRFGGSVAIVFAILIALFLAPLSAAAQSAAPKDIPRLPNGKPDFSGNWDHPRVLDVTRDGKGCGGAKTSGEKFAAIERVPACHGMPPGRIRMTVLLGALTRSGFYALR